MSYRYKVDRHRKGSRWRSANRKHSGNHKNNMEVNPNEFCRMDKLYHYTSMAKAISILATNKLFMSNLRAMNDVNESYRPLASYFDESENANSDEYYKKAETELQKYRQTSLTTDNALPGFAIPSMWGLYAEKGNGVCIVFNRKALVERLPASQGYYWANVSYIEEYNNDIIVRGNPEKYFKTNISNIFFKKSNDWKHEQEFRIIRRCENSSPAFIDITGCVIAVLMCYAEGDNNHNDSCLTTLPYKRLKLLFPNITILEWSNGIFGCILKDIKGKPWYPEPTEINVDI